MTMAATPEQGAVIVAAAAAPHVIDETRCL